MKSRKYVDELIMRVILEEERKLLKEGSYIHASPSEFWDAFVQPWVDVFKVIKLQTQVVINSVLYTIRMLNAETEAERENIKALHDSRVAELTQKTEDLIGPQRELNLALFIMNPGAYVLGSTGLYFSQHGTRDVEAFFKEAGFKNLPPAATGADAESLSTMQTYQSIQAPGAGILSRLKALFTESIDVELSAPFVVPGEKENIDDLNKAVDTGPLAATFKKMREDLLKNYTETQKFIEGIVPQAEFIVSLSKVKDERELTAAISKLEASVKKKNDKAEIKGYKNLPKAFQEDLKKLLADPKSRETAKKQLEKMKEKQKDLVINDKLIDEELKKAAWGKTMQALTSGTANQLEQMKSQAKEAFKDIDIESQYKDEPTRKQLEGTKIYDSYLKSREALQKLNSIKA